MRGNHLVNSDGHTVVLHGVNMSGTEYACVADKPSNPFGGQPEDSPRTISAMQSWGVDAVRIPLNEDCWLGINGVTIGGNAYRHVIEALVSRLAAAGFYYIER